MALTQLTIEDLDAMTKEDIEGLSGVKCIQTAFGNGPHGRKVETSELKALPKAERESLVEELRPIIGAVARV